MPKTNFPAARATSHTRYPSGRADEKRALENDRRQQRPNEKGAQRAAAFDLRSEIRDGFERLALEARRTAGSGSRGRADSTLRTPPPSPEADAASLAGLSRSPSPSLSQYSELSFPVWSRSASPAPSLASRAEALLEAPAGLSEPALPEPVNGAEQRRMDQKYRSADRDPRGGHVGDRPVKYGVTPFAPKDYGRVSDRGGLKPRVQNLKGEARSDARFVAEEIAEGLHQARTR